MKIGAASQKNAPLRRGKGVVVEWMRVMGEERVRHPSRVRSTRAGGVSKQLPREANWESSTMRRKKKNLPWNDHHIIKGHWPEKNRRSTTITG